MSLWFFVVLPTQSLNSNCAHSVAASYKPPMLVTRVRLPACAQLNTHVVPAQLASVSRRLSPLLRSLLDAKSLARSGAFDVVWPPACRHAVASHCPRRKLVLVAWALKCTGGWDSSLYFFPIASGSTLVHGYRPQPRSCIALGIRSATPSRMCPPPHCYLPRSGDIQNMKISYEI